MDDVVALVSRPSLLQWSLLPGVVGFGVGFLAPVFFDRDANLGPLLGIFVTGPGGAVVGLVLGFAGRAARLSAARQWQLLWASSVLLALSALFLSLPGPKLRGEVIQAETRTCLRPAQALDRAMSFWEKSLAGTGRPGWQDDLRRTAETDSGVVLEMNVARRLRLYEQRKPWNNGRITTTDWEGANRVRRYYARYAGDSCSDYPAGIRAMHYTHSAPSEAAKGPREWPPTSNLPRFLDLRIVEPVPAEYQRLIEDALR